MTRCLADWPLICMFSCWDSVTLSGSSINFFCSSNCLACSIAACCCSFLSSGLPEKAACEVGVAEGGAVGRGGAADVVGGGGGGAASLLSLSLPRERDLDLDLDLPRDLDLDLDREDRLRSRSFSLRFFSFSSLISSSRSLPRSPLDRLPPPCFSRSASRSSRARFSSLLISL